MNSIRRNMALRIGGAALLLSLGGGFGLYFALDGALATQFDHALATKAQALVSAAEIDNGKFEIDLDIQAFAGFGSGSPGDYFQISATDGSPVIRSPSLVTSDLAVPEGFSLTDRGFENIVLPDGRAGRAYWESFTPEIDDDEEVVEGWVAPDLRILVASDLGGLRRTLRTVALVISLFGCGAVLLSLLILRVVVGAGLQPLERLSADVQRIDVHRLEHRLSLDGLPLELHGVGAKLNELLERLAISFAREKRFTSDAAHELRTPLAELRVMTELGTQWPDEFTVEHGQEMITVLDELENLLNTLSLLARSEAGHSTGSEPIALSASLQEMIEQKRGDADSRGILIALTVEEGTFHSDPILWRAIIGNLIGNSVAYAPTNSLVRVEASPNHLLVKNEAPDLEKADLERLFERFWRKSASRSEKGHSGLGLSVVHAAAEYLGGSCRASLVDGWLTIEVTWAE